MLSAETGNTVVQLHISMVNSNKDPVFLFMFLSNWLFELLKENLADCYM